jgi:inner membrane transporter RhtA
MEDGRRSVAAPSELGSPRRSSAQPGPPQLRAAQPGSAPPVSPRQPVILGQQPAGLGPPVGRGQPAGPGRPGDPEPSAGPALIDRIPPQSFFLVSAVFHYLGPSFAVLLFARLDVLGVAWLRIASAAVVFAIWRRPWRLALRLDRRGRWVLVALGAVLAAMNSLFYLAVDKLPLSTVGSIEFLGTVLLAAAGARTRRNVAALVLTTVGVGAVTAIRIGGQPLGFVFAFANCALFMLYVILGHRIASSGTSSGSPGSQGSQGSSGNAGSRGRTRMSGIDQLGASMLIAAVVATPFGLGGALPAFSRPALLLAGVGVGVCSSVIPYVTDQLAMARMPRATFALMLALLPVFATVIGALVLGQVPTLQDLLGIALVIAGVALHQSH